MPSRASPLVWAILLSCLMIPTFCSKFTSFQPENFFFHHFPFKPFRPTYSTSPSLPSPFLLSFPYDPVVSDCISLLSNYSLYKKSLFQWLKIKKSISSFWVSQEKKLEALPSERPRRSISACFRKTQSPITNWLSVSNTSSSLQSPKELRQKSLQRLFQLSEDPYISYLGKSSYENKKKFLFNKEKENFSVSSLILRHRPRGYFGYLGFRFFTENSLEDFLYSLHKLEEKLYRELHPTSYYWEKLTQCFPRFTSSSSLIPSVSTISPRLPPLREPLNKLDGLIIDLRDNSGGSFPSSIDIGSLFYPFNTEMLTIRSHRRHEKTYSLSHSEMMRSLSEEMSLGDRLLFFRSVLRDLPILFLTNANTASSAEIFLHLVKSSRLSPSVPSSSLRRLQTKLMTSLGRQKYVPPAYESSIKIIGEASKGKKEAQMLYNLGNECAISFTIFEFFINFYNPDFFAKQVCFNKIQRVNNKWLYDGLEI